jgi:hypothetical protein
MIWRYAPLLVPAIVITVPARATVYLTVEQTQQALFPGEPMTPVALVLDSEQKRAIERHSGASTREFAPRVWRAAGGGFLIVDQVLGKHDYITYAVALASDGRVRGIEIMEYRESYGYEIRDADWRQQFIGKTSAVMPKLGVDIRNIGGATLSSKHVTDGVRRLLAFYDAVLR